MKHTSTAAILLLFATFVSSSHADQAFWDGVRAIQDVNHRNMQEFQDFCDSLPIFQPPVGGNVGFGGGFGGGMQQNQQTVQIVTQINNLLLSDMTPLYRNQFQQAVMQIGMQTAQNQQLMTQALLAAANQLSNQPGDDNQRAAFSLFLMASAFQGASPEQIVAFLAAVVQGADQNGQTWHRKGSFGALINQALPLQRTATPVRPPNPTPGYF